MNKYTQVVVITKTGSGYIVRMNYVPYNESVPVKSSTRSVFPSLELAEDFIETELKLGTDDFRLPETILSKGGRIELRLKYEEADNR